MSTQDTRSFHLGDILSIIKKDSPLLSPRHMEGIYDILEFMTGDDNLFTSQLPRVRDEVTPYVQEAFPQLVGIDLKQITEKNYKSKLTEWVAQFGEYHEVRRMHPEDHQVIDPHVELAMTHPEIEVVNFNVDSEEE